MKVKVKKNIRYLNPVVQLHLASLAVYKTLVAGRGSAKSFGNGLEVADKVERFPQSTGLFNSPTYGMIYTKTLIPMKSAWLQHMDYIEDIDYVVGKVPPKHFDRPWARPHKFENVVTFWNGTTIVFGSFDRPSHISGGSYDWVITDEAYLIDKQDYDDYVIPTMRGTHSSFRDLPKHLQHSFTSSMPHQHMGDWVLDNRAKSKTDPVNYSFIGWEPHAEFQLGSTWMNVEYLGAKAIAQMEMEMADHAVMVMIRNQRVTNYGNTFYPLLSARHFYIPEANDKMINVPLSAMGIFKRDATYDAGPDDYNPDMPINISHDWGKFNCITIDQEYTREVRFINCLHTLNGGSDPKDVDDLADEFCRYYKMHRNRLLYQWGDRTGNNRVANSKKTFFEQFADRVRANDKANPWRVIMKKTGDVEHLERHRFISRLHKEEDPRLPKVRHNDVNCGDLRTSLEGTAMNGDKKDKSTETNKSVLPQHSTHYTDAYDNRLYHGLRHRETSQGHGIDIYSTSLVS